jgi:hypothetical protein
MSSVSRYWQLVRIDSAGQRQVEEIAIAKAFFHQRFLTTDAQPQITDEVIQQQLLQQWRTVSPTRESEREAAEYCLRCFISHQIEQVCIQLEFKFGSQHGFTRRDLFVLVLEDEGRFIAKTPSSTPYQSLASKILQTFDPDQAGLTTWVMRQVRHHPELKAFLREQGVYLVTDWALLKDTSLEQLRQILSEFYCLVPTEIEQACQLLQSYHEIYRNDRLQHRQQGRLKGKEGCLPPTSEQLTRMVQYLRSQTSLTLSPESLMTRLQHLAKRLRQYRLHLRGGRLPVESLDQPTTYALAANVQTPELDPEQEAKQEFLTFYREQFLKCLEQAIEQVICDRLAYLQRKQNQTAQAFLQALHLFHCQGQSMGEIAPQIGLQAQFQVTRLMKLKEFRASVRSKLLQMLLQSVIDKAKTYATPLHLHQLNQ